MIRPSYTLLRQLIPKGADADPTVEDVIWGRDSKMKEVTRLRDEGRTFQILSYKEKFLWKF